VVGGAVVGADVVGADVVVVVVVPQLASTSFPQDGFSYSDLGRAFSASPQS